MTRLALILLCWCFIGISVMSKNGMSRNDGGRTNGTRSGEMNRNGGERRMNGTQSGGMNRNGSERRMNGTQSGGMNRNGGERRMNGTQSGGMNGNSGERRRNGTQSGGMNRNGGERRMNGTQSGGMNRNNGEKRMNGTKRGGNNGEDLEVHLTFLSGSSTMSPCRMKQKRIIFDAIELGDISNWTSMVHVRCQGGCGNLTTLVQLATSENVCCKKRMTSSCGVFSNTRLFCSNEAIKELTEKKLMSLGFNVTLHRLNQDKALFRRSCTRTSARQRMSRYRNNACQNFLMNDSMHDALESEDEREMVAKALYQNRRDLCIGSIGRNIQTILRSFRNVSLRRETRREILRTLNAALGRNFSSNWKNRSLRDTIEIVNSTESLLELLAGDMESNNDTYSYDAENLDINIFKIRRRRNFDFHSERKFEREKPLAFLGQASVNISFSEEQTKDCNFTVGISTIDNIAEYVQQSIDKTNETSSVDRREPVSILLSLVVLSSEELHDKCTDFRENPIKLIFTPEQEISENYTYKGHFLVANPTTNELEWSTSGLTTEVLSDGSILINTTHLTSFAILASPTGFSSSGKNAAANVALNVISYVGCAISIVCLILTIICLLVFRKKLKKGVLIYVHLNLAISLLLALIVFVAGVDYASFNDVLCKVVAALIQYFFLCAFFWMLGEGLMLYVLLVRVFGNIAERWYLLIPFCWVIPALVVSISAGLLNEEYIIKYDNNKTSCWINSDPGSRALWTFLGPVIIIICIDAVILALVMYSILKTRMYTSKVSDSNKNSPIELVKVTLKGSVILLPLLGLTWVFGLLAINKHTIVFVWLFTIVNSLQGFFIFVIHVLRNDYILTKLKKILCRKLAEKSAPGSTQLVALDGKSESSIATDEIKLQDLSSQKNSSDVSSYKEEDDAK